MIPAWNMSGVLPPFLGGSPTVLVGLSPYVATMHEIAVRFCTSPTRVNLFRGLVAYRKALAAIGISVGVQWIDGSFLEDVETLRKQPPKDIDLVNLFVRPPAHQSAAAWAAFLNANRALFDKNATKPTFGCDVYSIDIGLPAHQVFRQIAYWFGLFTHQRVSLLWKGIIQVSFSSNDDAALAYVDALVFPT